MLSPHFTIPVEVLFPLCRPRLAPFKPDGCAPPRCDSAEGAGTPSL